MAAGPDEGERKCLADIEAYGCHVVLVLESEDYPPFAYSVGIQRSTGAPELIVIGLRAQLAHFMINEYNSLVRAGQRFRSGDMAEEFLDGFACQFRAVDRTHYHWHFGWNLWLYGGPEFEALQLVYPDTRGIWPWQVPEDDPLRWQEPILDGASSA